MSWLDDTPDRPIDPPEYDQERCEWCDAELTIYSKSSVYCDDCLAEKRKSPHSSLSSTLEDITRSLDRLGESPMSKDQAE